MCELGVGRAKDCVLGGMEEEEEDDEPPLPLFVLLPLPLLMMIFLGVEKFVLDDENDAKELPPLLRLGVLDGMLLMFIAIELFPRRLVCESPRSVLLLLIL